MWEWVMDHSPRWLFPKGVCVCVCVAQGTELYSCSHKTSTEQKSQVKHQGTKRIISRNTDTQQQQQPPCGGEGAIPSLRHLLLWKKLTRATQRQNFLPQTHEHQSWAETRLKGSWCSVKSVWLSSCIFGFCVFVHVFVFCSAHQGNRGGWTEYRKAKCATFTGIYLFCHSKTHNYFVNVFASCMDPASNPFTMCFVGLKPS